MYMLPLKAALEANMCTFVCRRSLLFEDLLPGSWKGDARGTFSQSSTVAQLHCSSGYSTAFAECMPSKTF